MGGMEVLLANPRGFCAGVERAIEIVERALEQYGAPIYVRHEIVHNKTVVEDLRRKGAVFVEELDEVPAGGDPALLEDASPAILNPFGDVFREHARDDAHQGHRERIERR